MMDPMKGAYLSEEISPVALGLISDPPTIVLTYDLQIKKQTRFGEKKMTRRKRKMPLRDFTDKSNVKRYAFNLRQRHVKYLSQVTDVTLEKMLRMIQEIQKGKDVATSLKLVDKEYSVDPVEDLNKLTPAQLAQRKALMEETFRQNLIKPGDPGYVYDKEIDFENVKVTLDHGNDWDEEDEAESRSKATAVDDKKNEDIESVHLHHKDTEVKDTDKPLEDISDDDCDEVPLIVPPPPPSAAPLLAPENQESEPQKELSKGFDKPENQDHFRLKELQNLILEETEDNPVIPELSEPGNQDHFPLHELKNLIPDKVKETEDIPVIPELTKPELQVNFRLNELKNVITDKVKEIEDNPVVPELSKPEHQVPLQLNELQNLELEKSEDNPATTPPSLPKPEDAADAPPKPSHVTEENTNQNLNTTFLHKEAPLHDNCSTSSDIEEALENIETGILDEEDEDFWQ